MIFIGHSFSANVLLSDFCIRWRFFFTCIEIHDVVTVYLFIIIVTYTFIIISYFTKVTPETSFFSRFTSLFILFLAVLGLCCCVQAFSSCSEEATICCRARALNTWVSVWLIGSVVAWRHVGSFWIRDQTHVLCIGKQFPNHWTTREVPETF